MTKLKNDHSSEKSEKPNSWIRTFEADQEALDKGTQNHKTYTSYQGESPPCRLNVDLGLIVYNEITFIVKCEFHKCHWRKGGHPDPSLISGLSPGHGNMLIRT